MRAPVIQRRDRQVGMPGTRPPRRPPVIEGKIAEVHPSSLKRLGDGIQRSGQILLQVEAKQREEHDIASAQDAVNGLRQVARKKKAELLSLEGANAQGVLKKYQEWHDEFAGEVVTSLSGENQHRLFTQATDARREHDLDTLSMHQAREHKRHQETTLKSTISEIGEDALQDAAEFNEEDFEKDLLGIDTVFATNRAGMDNRADISQQKAAIRVAVLNRIGADDPAKARVYLEKWKEELEPVYEELKEKFDLENYYELASEKDGIKAQSEFVDNAGGLSDKSKRTIKRRLKEDRNQELAEERILIEETEDKWFESWNKKVLTEEEVEKDPNMSGQKKSVWISKVRSQKRTIKLEEREEIAAKNNDIYADWVEKVDLEAHSLTPGDIYADVDPNGGGLTGGQAAYLRDRLLRNQIDKGAVADGKAKAKAVKESIKSLKTTIKLMHENGEFGEIYAGTGSGEKNLPAKAEKNKHLLALQEWIDDHPDEDPTEWYDSFADRRAAERAVDPLGGWFYEVMHSGTPERERKAPLVSGEKDESIARQLLRGKDVVPSAITPELLEQVMKTSDFNRLKTKMLEE